MEALVVHDLGARAEHAEEDAEAHHVRERQGAEHRVPPRAQAPVAADGREDEQPPGAEQAVAAERRDLGVPRGAGRAEQERRVAGGEAPRGPEARPGVIAQPGGDVLARPAPARAAGSLPGRGEAGGEVGVGQDDGGAAGADDLGEFGGLEARVDGHGERAGADEGEDVEDDVDAVREGDGDARAVGVAERLVRGGEAGHVVLEIEVRAHRPCREAGALRGCSVPRERGDRGAIPVGCGEHRGEAAQVHSMPCDEPRLAAEPLDTPPDPLDVHRRHAPRRA